MGTLIYSPIASVDGYIEDASGSFDWAAPDEEVHGFINERSRSVRTFVLGRRMYDTLAVWETMDVTEQPAAMADFQAIWLAADKVICSRTLPAPRAARTRVEPAFDPEALRALKASTEHPLAIGGPELAGQALAAGLVDEIELFLVPTAVGAGKPWLPTGVRLELELLAERSFGNGTVFLHYAVV